MKTLENGKPTVVTVVPGGERKKAAMERISQTQVIQGQVAPASKPFGDRGRG